MDAIDNNSEQGSKNTADNNDKYKNYDNEFNAKNELNNMILSYLDEPNHIKLIFQKECRYSFLYLFDKQTRIYDIVRFLSSLTNSNVELFLNDVNITRKNSYIYDYIVKHNITSIAKYRSQGCYYLIKYIDNIHHNFCNDNK